ncbi:MAG TPA: hypothetical protein VEB41_08665 [Burkholderiales bacterium]|nr:hypothetical protein [Burkholderiales bacterium]
MNLVESPAALGLASVVQIEPVGRGKVMGRVSPAWQRAGAIPRATTPPAFMSFDAFCRLVSGFLPPLELRFAGEEDPLLHPRFFDMVSYAASRGFEITAVTRLPGLSSTRAEACAASGLRRMHVLVENAPSPLVQRSLRRLEQAKARLGVEHPEVLLTAPDGPPLGAAPAQRFAFSGRPAVHQ